MKNIKYIIFFLLIICLNFTYVQASCTKEELSTLKEEADKIKVTYKHLGEITKDNGEKVYNEFLVTSTNIKDGFYIHLSPLTDHDFEESENELKIILTTGEWIFSIYSKECETIVKDITVKLPRFNIYSLDPLCEGINSDDFKLCSKYYEYEFSRETFERKVNDYRIANNIGTNINSQNEEKKGIANQIVNIINKYKFFIIGFIVLLFILIIFINIIKNKKKRSILQ